MSMPHRRLAVPLFPCAIALVLLVFHGFYTAGGLPPPREAYRTPFAELGYVLRYLAGQQPDRVIASRRAGTLHLFSAGDLEMQVRGYGAAGARALAAGARPALDALKAQGVTVVPVLVPTKLSLYREELPYQSANADAGRSRPPMPSPRTLILSTSCSPTACLKRSISTNRFAPFAAHIPIVSFTLRSTITGRRSAPRWQSFRSRAS